MIAFGDGILLIQDGIHSTGNCFAIVDVYAADLVDIQTQEPFAAFPDIFHVPQRAALFLHHGFGKLPDLFSDLHTILPFQQERLGMAPQSFVKSTIDYLYYTPTP